MTMGDKQDTPRGHTPCVPERGWRGAVPPLTPPEIVAVVDCAGEGVSPASPVDGASRWLDSGKLSASCDKTAFRPASDETVVVRWAGVHLDGAGSFRERRRNHRASLLAEDTRP